MNLSTKLVIASLALVLATGYEKGGKNVDLAKEIATMLGKAITN